MKKTLFIIAHLALLVSCAKTLEVDSEKSGKAESSGEIMLSTSANLTKAITEGKNLPYGSVIGLYTNFYSDVKTKDKGVRNPYYDYNQIKSFTYDFRTDVWRGASPVEALSELVMRGTRNFSEGSFKDSNLLDELLSNAYKTSSLYWPGEERVYMDYTAYSTSNLMSVLGQLLLLNFSDELSLDESKIASLDSMIVLNPMGAGEPKNLSHSFGDDRNYNKMAIGYNFGIFNDLPKIMQKAFDGPYLKPGALAIIIGLCAITNTSTGFDDLDADLHLDNGAVQSLIMEFISDGKLNMAAVNNLLNMSNEEFKTYIQDKLNQLHLTDILNFCRDYVKAYAQMIGEEGTSKYDTKDMFSEIIGEDVELLPEEELRAVVNKAYCIFMNCVPKISRYLQDDLMYAYGRSISNDGQPLQVTFNHAKAWVKVVVCNKSRNDILISSMSFEDVKTRGTLIIDNSLTNFEVYWDYDQPVYQRRPRFTPYGMGFEPYDQTNLDGTTDSTVYPQDNIKGNGSANNKEPEANGHMNVPFPVLEEVVEDTPLISTSGFIPDMYIVPAGCVGPAQRVSYSEKSSTLDSLPAINFSFSRTYGESIAMNLGGAMFPVQEPGLLKVEYLSLPSDGVDGLGAWEFGLGDGLTSIDIDMCSKVQEVKKYFNKDYFRELTLNLPRQTWQMGNVYIYVININDNEITIEPYVANWDSHIIGNFMNGDGK